MEIREKLSKLRQLMEERGMAAYIVPTADPHQSEYPADHWKARAWLSGFMGSAGTLVVTLTQAGLWTDSRYHIRAAQELAGSGIDLYKFGSVGVPSYSEWLNNELAVGSVIGCYGKVLSMAEFTRLDESFQGGRFAIVTHHDLIGELRQDRPRLPDNPIFIHDDKFAGETRFSKIQRIRNRLSELEVDIQLLTALDDIAWTLNIRGSDVPYNPVAICYLTISKWETRLFIEAQKVPDDVRQILENDGILFSEYKEIYEHLKNLESGTKILIDPERTNYSLKTAVSEACTINFAMSIPYALKAAKNETEVAGIIKSQVRDGVAMAKWMFWLERQADTLSHTEITVAEKLAEFRSQGEYFQGLSFGTICGYKSNSAIGHYSSNPLTAPSLSADGILLIDSGGQYLDGTTDITRTLSLGKPTPEEKRAFTLVLKCHIRLAAITFPRGTSGAQLDAIAREFLWRELWNCRHGIGHGVGYFLNVHEGPQRFREDNFVPLELNMLCSNEPGVYFQGRFGVRIENLLITVSKGTTEFGEFYGFETVTLCPIDLELVDVSLLSVEERNWLNAYHQRVYETLAEFLSLEERDWLRHATRGI